MIIAVASGKGGTGKTTVAVNLARALAPEVRLLDCDVEAPNARLFLAGSPVREEVVTIPVPSVDGELCAACGDCARFCAYNALASFGTEPLVFAELCHGCGGCAAICPQGAIHEVGRRIGLITTVDAGGIDLVEGRLDIGVASAPPLIRAVRANTGPDTTGPDTTGPEATVVVDAPPGTSCPVVAALRDADLALLVTEPTPFGLHDLTLAVAMVRALELPCAVVINRVGVGDRRVHDYCAREELPILLEIPDDRRIAEAYARGRPLWEALPEFRPHFVRLADACRAFPAAFANGSRRT
ncbi:MAG: ATP-binding protein [Candidatus Krumholzibacteriia bacterium]